MVWATAVPELEFAVSWPLRPGEAAPEVGVVLPEAADNSVEAVKVAEVPVAAVPGRGPLDSVVLKIPVIELAIPVGAGVVVSADVVVLAGAAVVF